MEEAVLDVTSTILQKVDDAVDQLESIKELESLAVNYCLSACLNAISMLHVAREDHSVTDISQQHRSWEKDEETTPCQPDTWLRGALPTEEKAQSLVPQASVVSEKLSRQPSPGSSSRLTTPRHSSSASTPSTKPEPRGQENSPPSTAMLRERTPAQPPPGRGRAATSSFCSPAMARLREELQIRRQQEAVAVELQKKDEEARRKVANLQKDLKGKKYAYDHRGEVILLAPLHFDSCSTHLTPEFKICSDPPNSPHSRSPSRASQSRPRSKSPGQQATHASHPGSNASSALMGKAVGGMAKGPVADFKPLPNRTQPSTMDTITLATGATLRSGSKVKVGPRMPASTTRPPVLPTPASAQGKGR